jgi:YbbR domain-containing protein
MMFLDVLRVNVKLKLFALLIAIVWWAVVRGEDTRVRDVLVPVDYINLPASMELSGRIIDTVTVRLRAPDPILRNLAEDRLSASIDLARAPMGEQRVPMTGEMLRVPAGVEVVRISPAAVPVRLERRARRQVPIVAEFSGHPPKGYDKTGYVVSPSVATIEGPSSEVAQVTRALAGTIFLEGETANLEFVTRPIAEAPAGNHIRIVEPTEPVRVRVSIGPVAGTPAAPAAPAGRASGGTAPRRKAAR